MAGTVAGAVATVPMTLVMKTFEGRRPLPHREITENAIGPAMDGLHEDEREAVSLMAHFGYGATAGAGYSAFAGKSGLPPAAEGALYGLALWGGSYLGLMPATGLYRSAKDDPPSRNVLMVGAHLIWGAALGVVWHALAGNRENS